MRKITWLGASLFVLACQPAFAADIPPRTQPIYKAPAVAPAPVLPWQGPYVGLHVGYGHYSIDNSGGLDDGSSADCVLGGGQAGYDFQWGHFVLGGVVDGSWSGVKGSESITDPTTGVTASVSHQLDWMFTARARAGYAFDRFLVYGTVGGAFAHFEESASALGVTVSDTANKSGWTAGAGVEYRLLNHWSLGAEWIYVGIPGDDGAHLNMNIGRLDVNYRF
jgi:outer membrane immunogenic protein